MEIERRWSTRWDRLLGPGSHTFVVRLYHGKELVAQRPVVVQVGGGE
jgi:hypothetical protein